MVAEDCRVVTPSATFDSDWHFLEELQIDGTIGSLESTEDTETIGGFLLLLIHTGLVLILITASSLALIALENFS